MSNGYNYSGYAGDQGHDVPPPHNQHMQQEHRQQPPGRSYPTDYDHDNQMYYQQQQQHMDSGYPPSSMPGSDVPDPSYYSPPTGDPQYQPSHYNQPPPSQHHHQQPPPPQQQQQHSHLPPPQHQQHQQHYSRSQPYDTVDLYDQADSYATSDHRYSSHEPPHVSSYPSKPMPHHSPELHATVPPGRHIDNTSTTPRRSHTSSFSNGPPESSMGTAGGAAGLRGRQMTRQPSHPPVGMPDHPDHHMSGHSMGQHASNASRHGHGGPMGQHQPQSHRSSGHSSGAPSHHINHTAGYPSNPGPVSGYPPQDYPSPSHRPSQTSSRHVAGYPSGHPSGHPSGRASSRPSSVHAGSGSGSGVAPSTGGSRGQPGMLDGSQRTASRGLGPGPGPGQRPRPESIHQMSPRSHPASLHGNAPPSMPSNQGYSGRHVSQPTAIPNERQSFDSRAGSVDYAHVPSLMPRDHQPMENRRDLRGEHRDRAPSVAHSVASAPSKRPGGPLQIASKEKIDALRQNLSFKLLDLARKVKTVTHQYRGKGALTKEDKDQLREGLCKFESQQVKTFLKMNDIEGYRNVMEKRRKLLALRLRYFEEVLKLQKEFLPLVQGVLKKYNEGFRLEQSPEKRREYQAHIANLMSYEKHLKAPDELHKVKGLDYVVSARNYLTKLREHYERRREAANRNGAQSYSQGRAPSTQPQQQQQHQQGGARQPTSHESTPVGNASSRYPPQHADARQQSQAYPSSHRNAQQSPQLTSSQRQILYDKQQHDLHWQQKEKEMKEKVERERRQTLELEKRQQEEAARRKKLELQKRQEEAQRLKEQKLKEEQNKQRLLEQQRKAQLMQERQQMQQRQQQQQMQQDKIRQQQLLAQQQQQQQQQKPQQHPHPHPQQQQQQQQQMTQRQPPVKQEAQQQRPLVQNVYMPSQRGAAADPNQVTPGVGPTGSPSPSVPPAAGQVKTESTAQNHQTQQHQAGSHQVGPRQGQPPASKTQVQTQPQVRLQKNLPPQGFKAEQQSKTSPSSRSTSSGGNKTSRPDDDTLQPNNKKQRVGGIVDAYDTPASVMESIPTPGNLAQVASTSPEAVLPSRRQVIDIGPGVAASLDPACNISNLGSKGCYRALRQFTGWA